MREYVSRLEKRLEIKLEVNPSPQFEKFPRKSKNKQTTPKSNTKLTKVSTDHTGQVNLPLKSNSNNR